MCSASISLATSKKAKRLVLSIGNSIYSDPFWKTLNYASQDAVKFGRFLQTQADPKFEYFDILSSENSKLGVSKKEIIDAFTRLKEANRLPQDIVIVYLSGHGTIARETDMTLSRYFVTYDTKLKDVLNTGLPLDKITQLFRQLKSKKKVLILDFCHSGTGKSRLTQEILLALESQKGSYLPELEDDDVQGEYILAASEFGQAALESRKLQGGVYTHFLLESLKKASHKNAAISITEAHSYARKKTFLYTNGTQTPTQISKTIGTDPILINSNQRKNINPFIYSFWKNLSNFRVLVDGKDRGPLAEGIRIPEGKSHISLVDPTGEESLINREIQFEPSKEYSALALINLGKIENWKKLKQTQDQLRIFPGEKGIYDSSLQILDAFNTLHQEKDYPARNQLKRQLYFAIIKHYASANRHFKILRGHQYAINDVVFNPRYEVFATAGFDNKLLIWSLKGELLNSINTESHTSSLTFSPDGKYLASAEYSGVFNIWSWNGSKRYFRKKAHNTWINQVIFSPNSQNLVTASDSGHIKIWKKQKGKQQWQQFLNKNAMRHQKGINNVSFNQEGTLLGSASKDHTAKIWDLNGKILKTFHHNDWVTQVAFAPKKNKISQELIATSSFDGSVKLWKDLSKPLVLNHERKMVNRVEFSPDGDQLISATDGDYGNVYIWDMTGKRIKALLKEQNRREFFGVSSAKYNRSGDLIGAISKGRTPAVSGTDRILLKENQFYIWDQNESSIHSFASHKHWINQFSFSPEYPALNTKLAVTVGWNSKVRFWKIMDFAEKISSQSVIRKVFFDKFAPESFLFLDSSQRLKLSSNKIIEDLELNYTSREILRAVYHAGKKIAAILDKKGNLDVWDLNRNTSIFSIRRSDFEHLSFNPQGDAILISNSSGQLISIDISVPGRTPRFHKILSDEKDKITCFEFSSDGELIAVGFFSGKVLIVDKTGKLIHTLLDHKLRVFSLSFSPKYSEDETLVSASLNGEVSFWKSGNLVGRGKHKTRVYSIGISSHGVVASASSDRTIKLWDLEGNYITSFEKAGRKLAFTPKGALVYATESRGKVYKMPLNRLVEKLCEDIAYFVSNEDREVYQNVCKIRE